MDIDKYLNEHNEITIYGIRYSSELFRELGIQAQVGQILQIEKRENGLLTVKRLHDRE